jgi:hypothetical protein
MSRHFLCPFPRLQRGRSESDAIPCELQWPEGERCESAECESDAVLYELQWLQGEEGESGFAGNELA